MTDFKSLLIPGKKGHLIGIGGVSMSPLAEVLIGMGLKISGSDINDSETVKRMRQLGIRISIGHDPGQIDGDTDFIVRTAAVRDDNPEIAAAGKQGIPVFERTQAWGAIMRDYRHAVCIAGTHGKTTTTSMATHILMAAELDPTVMIGGTLPLLHAGHRVGRGDVIVMESCEYFNSFHSFFPTVAVILNIEADHLDFFKNLEEVKDSFRKFAALVPENGYIVANADDENTMSALLPLGRPVFTFGLDKRAHVSAANLVSQNGKTEFDVMYKGEVFTRVELLVPGRHNVTNALAAIASSICLGVPPQAVRKGLSAFRGAGRRFELKGSFNGADIYDDYAHHPSELKALLDGVAPLGYDRIIAVFQPHTYTRTKLLFQDFARELSRPDLVLLADIYAAREKNTIGISSADLARAVPGCEYCPSFDRIESRLRQEARPGDLILTIGAGDIYLIGERLARTREKAKDRPGDPA